MRRWLGVRALVAAPCACFLLAACEGGLPTGEPAVEGPPFVTVPCLLNEVPTGLDVTCGTVTVPQNPDMPEGGTIDIRVAILKSLSSTPAEDPIVYLDGVAGGSSVASALYYAGWTQDQSLKVLLAKRYIVAIDLRGTGGSTPNLDCTQLNVTPLPANAAGLGLFSGADVTACRSSVDAEGATLASFGTVAAAADVDLVRRSLGLHTWNVVGVSYGARVALEYVRRHEAAVRTLVLDSVIPPDVDTLGGEGAALARSLALVWTSCAQDPNCHDLYPDPAAALIEVVQRLTDNPVDANSHGGAVHLDGATFMEGVALMLRDGDSARQLPQRIYEARDGVYGFMAAVLGAPRGRPALGVTMTVMCSEEMTKTSGDAIEAGLSGLPAPAQISLAGRFYALACPLWSVPAAPPSLHAPVSSSVPTYLLAGEIDPVSPPDWSNQVASHLQRARVQEIAGEGEAVLRLPCVTTLAGQFIDDPATARSVVGCSSKTP